LPRIAQRFAIYVQIPSVGTANPLNEIISDRATPELFGFSLCFRTSEPAPAMNPNNQQRKASV
jgi:hypothetical protein